MARAQTGAVLIVGAGLSGLRTAENLAALGYPGPIHLVGEETHRPYNRPPLSKKILAGSAGIESLVFRHQHGDRIHLHLGRRVAAVDLAGGVARLESGESIGFSAMVAASGVRPRRLPVGSASPQRHVLKTFDDASRLRRELVPGAHVLIAGGGFVACEVASSAAARGCRVTVLSRSMLPMAGSVGTAVSRRVLRLMSLSEVNFQGQAVVADIRKVAAGVVVELADGRILGGNVLLEAIGSDPAADYLRGAGIELVDGLKVGPSLLVEGAENLYAVGDIAKISLPRLGSTARRFEHWSVAVDTARRAASSIITGPANEPLEFLPSAWSDQWGMRIQSFGTGAAGSREVLLSEPESDQVVAGFVDSTDRLVGVAALSPAGRPSPALAWRSKIGSPLCMAN